jgi:hypothetical protein
MVHGIGIVDEPVAPGATDNLNIEIHSEALIDFVTNTNTPITVGIQGEWGSGKTSLINSIHHAFENQEKVKQIWINSWEYSLLSTPEEALLKIVNKIIGDLVEADPDQARVDKIKGSAEKMFKGALRIGAQVALGTEAAKVANEILDSSAQSISELRKQLGDVVHEMANRGSNPYEKVVIYVDDLDRIEPKNAVAILELLKNIFSVPKCVFILAIDYQVVVKGLEYKFGKQTPENEWEFRAFFDKIIQLPFMMPMGEYNIGKYVNSLLGEIGFVKGEGLDDEAISEIILRTIGGNPRSIKRLVNSLSLIQIFADKRKLKLGNMETNDGSQKEEISSEDEKFLLFSLLCLQIAYPPIYSLLVQEPNFPIWDDDFAFRQTNRSEERVGDNNLLSPEAMKKIFDAEFEIAKQSEDYDEDWEQALYRICYGRPRLKPRVADISKFFSYIKDDLLSDRPEIVGDAIASVLSQTSVTSVTATDAPQQQGQTSKKRYFDGPRAWLEELKAYGLKENQISNVSNLLASLKDFYDEVRFSRSDGATFFIDGKRYMAMNVTGKRNPKVSMGFAKDFEHNYRKPKISGFETKQGRKFVPENPLACRYFAGYGVAVPVNDMGKYHFSVLKWLSERNYQLHTKYKDKLLRDNELKARISSGDEEVISYLTEIMSDDYTYDFEID